MTKSSLALPPMSFARIAGALYLLIAVAGAFAIGYVPSVILVAGDAAATATNLVANRTLFGFGVAADVIVILAEIVLTVMLFTLFKPTSPTLSLVAAVARLIMVAVMAVNVLFNVMPMVLLTGAGPTLAPDQAQSLAMLFFAAHQYGIYVWDMLFGLHLFALGYLIYRSGYFPRLIGLAMLIGSPGYFLTGLIQVTFIDNALLAMLTVGLLIIATVAELVFAFWLLIRGINVTAYESRIAG